MVAVGIATMLPTPYTIGATAAFISMTEELADREEKACLKKFGEEYDAYMRGTSRWGVGFTYACQRADAYLRSNGVELT